MWHQRGKNWLPIIVNMPLIFDDFIFQWKYYWAKVIQPKKNGEMTGKLTAGNKYYSVKDAVKLLYECCFYSYVDVFLIETLTCCFYSEVRRYMGRCYFRDLEHFSGCAVWIYGYAPECKMSHQCFVSFFLSIFGSAF